MSIDLGKSSHTVKDMLRSYSNLLFLNDPKVGFILFCLSFVQPSAGFHALISFTMAIIFEKFTQIKHNGIGINMNHYNAILVGLSIGFIFKLSVLSIVFATMASIFTLFFTATLSSVFYRLFNLPILNLPFAIVATFIYLASVRYSSLYITSLTNYNFLNLPHIPYYISGFLRSLGTLMFLPYDSIGLIILAIFISVSRISVMLTICGYFIGVVVHGCLSGSLPIAFSDFYSFNYILIALALGGYFLIPSPITYVITATAVVSSTIILDAATVFWSAYQIPVFTLPFLLTVLLFLYTLYVYKFGYRTLFFMGTPEKNLEYWHLNKERFSYTMPAPFLPFAGEWSIYQGEDGKWTHKGGWKHAFDFVIINQDDNKSYLGDGKKLSDYYCFKKSVLSPITGTVVGVENSQQDNEIGSVDNENNWGNYVIIYSQLGYYVELSHFAKDSISCNVGDIVYAGQVIGKCGNSGYSPQPHIHMQCQLQSFVGAPTIPFTFSNAIRNGFLVNNHKKLCTNDTVAPLVFSNTLSENLMFILDDEYRYDYFCDGKKINTISMKICIDTSGTYYIEDVANGDKLYFLHKNDSFLFLSFIGKVDSPIRLFYLATPSIIFTDSKISWEDFIPQSIVDKRKFNGLFVKSFNHSFYSAKGTYSANGFGKIIGKVEKRNILGTKTVETTAVFDHLKGVKDISVIIGDKNYELKRVDL